jgi:hypothetical protein
MLKSVNPFLSGWKMSITASASLVPVFNFKTCE